MDIRFIGATEDVTGSMTLLTNATGMLLVDSGLYQGVNEVVVRNKNKLPFDPAEVSAIILTHAHLDHSGFIPRLVKLGFRGKIFCTQATMKLARIIMSDSAKLMSNEEHALHNFYEPEHVAISTSLFKTKKVGEVFEVLGMRVELLNAGHILGATSVIIKGEKSIVFSGDLGRSNDPLIVGPGPCPAADIVVMESTYGDRVRKGNLEDDLFRFLRDIKAQSRVGIIASFAVARAQLLVTLIHKFYSMHPEEKVRTVIDSPMMVEANNVYKEFSKDLKMPEEVIFALSNIEVIDQAREWDSIQKKDGPLIVITSSGMVSGGRIWRYLENWQQDERACLFLPGYQGAGTAGRLLSEGHKIITDEKGKKINWHGEVLTSHEFSSHADQSELIAWLKNISLESQIYLNHGEKESKEALKNKLTKLGYKHIEIASSELSKTL